MERKLIFTILILLTLRPAFAKVWYVNEGNISGTINGESWSTAFTIFQAGVNAAASGDSVWVASGTYKPGNGSFFSMAKGVKIYGGFAGTETSFTQRNFVANVTILMSNNNSVIINNNNGLDVTAVLDGFTISSNYTNAFASIEGGGIYNYYSSPTISNVIFGVIKLLSGRSSNGGGMYNDHSSPVIANTDFNLITIKGSDSTFGGGMFNYFSSPIISNSSFNGDTIINETNSIGPGGEISTSAGGAIYNYHSNPIVSNTSFNLGAAENGYGGAICDVLSSPTFTNCSFSNSYSFYGGGMFNDSSSSPVVKYCSFSNNNGYFYGGGMCNHYNSSPTIVVDSFVNNTGNGGDGIYNDTLSSPLIDSSFFRANSGGENGGAMYNDSSSSPVITNSEFENNTTLEDGEGGGAIYNNNSSPTITNDLFTGNYSGSPQLETGNGGAIANDNNSQPSIKHCTFTRNYADLGGAVYDFYSASKIDSSTFSFNSAINGDGGGIDEEYSSSVITNCLFNSDTAFAGGGLSTDRSHTIIDKSIFFGNIAGGGGDGGGMISIDLDSSTVKNTIFANNSATGTLQYSGGGGLLIQVASPSVINVVFVNDSAYQGGGILISSPFNINVSSPTITDCTFARDSASYQGAAISNVENATPIIVNSVFWGNIAAGVANDIYSDPSSTSNITHSFTQSNITGIGNLTGTSSPFVNIDNPAGTDGIFRTSDDGLVLLAGSPPVGTGSVAAIPMGITTDITGAPRTTNGLVDMGAYEGAGVLPITLLSFTAQKQNDHSALLLWTTATEINNKDFEIQRSTNGNTWTTIGIAPGAGTSSLQHNYSYTDSLPASGNDYYRLKQIDLDGNYVISEVRVVNFGAANISEMFLYPNPVASYATVYSVQPLQDATVELMDYSGRLVMEMVNISGNTFKLNVTNQPPGLYIVKVIMNGETVSLKFEKQ